MFDRSFLREAILEFVVLADTHYMLDAAPAVQEFASRGRQTARAGVAWTLAQSLDIPLVMHLGDLVQEYPDTAEFPRALRAAIKQLSETGIEPYHVAGNHDIGDKPDPLMPTHEVTAQSLEHWQAAVGPSWYSFDRAGCHLVVVNSQIMNSQLPQAARQRQWLERDLADNSGRRLFLFLHLPPYLTDENEPALGHYDNLDQPARRWLLDLVRQHDVEMLMAAHVHCAFMDRIGKTRYFIANSTSFTRPGFCHLFTSSPPPDQGRDDAAKLGFYLCRVRRERTDVHFLRTDGATAAGDYLPLQQRKLITRTSATLERSPLALTLSHPLSSVTQIPLAWPSAIRQSVRNDYLLLSCVELGATAVRVPLADLGEPLLSQRLAILRAEGVLIVATAIWSNDLDIPAMRARYGSQVDAWELQLAGTPWPNGQQLELLGQWSAAAASLSLSTIVPGQFLAGKQHPRTRHGFRADELAELDARLSGAGVRVDRVLCRLASPSGLWECQDEISRHGLWKAIGCVDVQLELLGRDDTVASADVAEAFAAATVMPGSRLYIEPLIDFDRTMDVRHGLLDTLCNPRPPFHVLCCLNTILTAAGDSLDSATNEVESHLDDQLRAVTIRTPETVYWLLLPRTEVPVADLPESPFPSEIVDLQVYALAQRLVRETTSHHWKTALGPLLTGPVLLQG